MSRARQLRVSPESRMAGLGMPLSGGTEQGMPSPSFRLSGSGLPAHNGGQRDFGAGQPAVQATRSTKGNL